jgi:flagellar biogenesis protein FliO
MKKLMSNKSVELSVMGIKTVFNGVTASIIYLGLFLVGIYVLVKFISKPIIHISIG